MANPPPSYSRAGDGNLLPHPSLPARPPPSSHSARHHAPVSSGYASNVPAYGGYAPASSASMATNAPPSYSGGYQPNLTQSTGSYYQQPNYAATPLAPSSYPQPRGFGKSGTYDPEVEAQIAEWNSAYAAKDDANGKKAGQSFGARAPVAVDVGATEGTDAGGHGAGNDKGKQKTVMRQGGGKTWEDPSLLEWDPLHPRLFVGNLAGEVTDESLLKAFSKYPSVSKARVVREKRSTKSKSYGFVSFADTDEFFRAAKEMEGKYIGSHPVRVRRATTEIHATAKRDEKHKKGKNNKGGNKANGAATGAKPGAGMGLAPGAGGSLLGASTFSGSGVKKPTKGPKVPKLLG